MLTEEENQICYSVRTLNQILTSTSVLFPLSIVETHKKLYHSNRLISHTKEGDNVASFRSRLRLCLNMLFDSEEWRTLTSIGIEDKRKRERKKDRFRKPNYTLYPLEV